jgi:hypothetical protein
MPLQAKNLAVLLARPSIILLELVLPQSLDSLMQLYNLPAYMIGSSQQLF